jgi:hypothetical protein
VGIEGNFKLKSVVCVMAGYGSACERAGGIRVGTKSYDWSGVSCPSLCIDANIAPCIGVYTPGRKCSTRSYRSSIRGCSEV